MSGKAVSVGGGMVPCGGDSGPAAREPMLVGAARGRAEELPEDPIGKENRDGPIGANTTLGESAKKSRSSRVTCVESSEKGNEIS